MSTEKEKSPFSENEEKVLGFWKENDVFRKSVQKEAPRGDYVFYDGPPFITGLPHYATLLPSIAKDVIPRYRTMRGYRVRRVWGWDCHGLPAENKVEEELGLKNKKDIEEIGVGKFTDACRDYVRCGSEQWRWYIDRIGRWVDIENAYKTMDLDFMESVIWSFKELHNKGLIYEGYRTSLHCPRCATPLSKFEITMDAGSYRDIEDDAIVVEFKTDNDLYFLAWTTTAWTLPGNMALAVGEDIDYAIVQSSGKKYILAEKKIEEFFKGRDYNIVERVKGKDLVGLDYQPVAGFRSEEIQKNKNIFKVYTADFVGTEEGTGIVHIAPGFGEDDFELGKRVGLPIAELMDESGIYTEESKEWGGHHFEKVNCEILDRIKDRVFSKSKYIHSYPFCYRCNSKLIHKTQKAWYLDIEKVRRKMIKSNREINWVPEHFKEGRFKYNLENAPDWCLSRSRYWGSPIPVWKCSGCGGIKVVGSIKEIEDLSGKKIKDLHRPMIDEAVFGCRECGKEMKRVPEVFDCWFESGSMPFAQFHYPFQKKEEWKDLFPADFIIEYTGQLRGWFYYLHVLSNALFDSISFKNVIVTGVLAGNDGRKMSKSFGNYPDPKRVLNQYGSDALRTYFMSSPIMMGGDMSLSEEGIQDALRKNVILLQNVANFYRLFAKNNNFSINEKKKEPFSGNILDKWIIARMNEINEEASRGLEEYNLPLASQAITSFIGDLSTWYIRRSRERLKSGDEAKTKKTLETIGYLLLRLSRIIAPTMPFLAESVWQGVTGNDFKDGNKSVHLEGWPEGGDIDRKLLSEMADVRKIAELGLARRDEKRIKVRQPLAEMKVINYELSKEYIEILKEELNVKEIKSVKGKGEVAVDFDFEITEELRLEGLKREMIRTINDFRKKKGLGIGDDVILYYQTESELLKKLFTDEKTKKELLGAVLAQEAIEGVGEGVEEEKKANVNGNEIILGIRRM